MSSITNPQTPDQAASDALEPLAARFDLRQLMIFKLES
jgi:hypothetical protein